MVICMDYLRSGVVRCFTLVASKPYYRPALVGFCLAWCQPGASGSTTHLATAVFFRLVPRPAAACSTGLSTIHCASTGSPSLNPNIPAVATAPSASSISFKVLIKRTFPHFELLTPALTGSIRRIHAKRYFSRFLLPVARPSPSSKNRIHPTSRACTHTKEHNVITAMALTMPLSLCFQ